MSPNRGMAMAVVRARTPRAFQLQCRHLSSASRRTAWPLHLAPTSSAIRSPPRRLHLSPAFPLAVRHASTHPPSASPTTSQPEVSTDLSADFPNLDTINIDIPDPVTPSLTDGIGYLHSLGIDHGYGPSSLIQWMLEHYHIWGGLPWWAAIAATALTLRLAILPLYIRASDNNARESALVSVIGPMSREMRAAQKRNDQMAVMQAWSQLLAVRKRAGVSYLAAFGPLIPQAVIGICGFRLLGECARLPVPAFTTGGFGHLMDLTVSDPYLLLPLAMATGIHLIVRLGGESGAMSSDTMTPMMRNFSFYGIPVVIFVIMGWQPGALCVWFTTTGAIGIAQAIVLRNPRVRQALRIAPMYKPTKAEAAESPMAQLMAQLMPSKPVTASKGHIRRPSLDIGPDGKSAAVGMGPSWQAPNLHTRAGNTIGNHGSGAARNGVIDVRARSISSGPGPTSQSPGLMGGAVGAVKRFAQSYMGRKKIALAAWSSKESVKGKKRQADAYEQRATARGGQSQRHRAR